MQKFFIILGTFLIAIFLYSFMIPTVSAQGWTQGQQVVSSGNTGLPETTAVEVVVNVLKWLLGLVFLLTVFAFVGSGIMFIMSFSNSGIVGMAKDWLTYAIIGLVVSVLGFVIVLAISNVLLGNSPSSNGRGNSSGGSFSIFFNI